MNENASSSPHEDDHEPDPNSSTESASETSDPTPLAGPAPGGDAVDEPAVVAELVAPAVSGQVRIGSPFAVDPFEFDPSRAIEAFYDVGPLKYTAMGAVAASALVLCFGLVAAYVFPAGGTMIAALGCVLSIFGMYSSYRLTAAALLAVHLGLFVVCYGGAII